MKKQHSHTTKRRRKATSTTFRRKANPATVRAHRRGRRAGRRRNPNFVKQTGGFFRMGIVAVLAALVTRQVPQIVLKDKNQGIIGYLANMLTAMGVSVATSRVLGKQDGLAAGIGGATYTVTRMASENFSPAMQALSLAGLGDVTAHVGRKPGLGTIEHVYMPYPRAFNPDGSPVIPPEIIEASRAAQAIPGAAMAGLRGRRAA